jgi:hypothetical protein
VLAHKKGFAQQQAQQHMLVPPPLWLKEKPPLSPAPPHMKGSARQQALQHMLVVYMVLPSLLSQE